MIALSVTVTVLVLRPDSGGDESPNPTNGASEFASADDVGPVNIIVEDPTCAAWGKISRAYAEVTEAVNWVERDKSIPASAWTADQRAMYEAVAEAVTRAAEDTSQLVTLTPHRVMRELYQQFIAYADEFVESVPSYVPANDQSVAIANTLTSGLSAVCSSIQYRSAEAVAPLLTGIPISGTVTPPDSEVQVSAFLSTPSPVCPDWNAAVFDFNRNVADWQTIDPSIPSEDWTPDQKLIYDRVGPTMMSAAETFEAFGRRSENSTLEDFAFVTAQYLRAYVEALSSYSAADSYLVRVANFVGAVIDAGCKAAT